jgi:hypothetical protein
MRTIIALTFCLIQIALASPRAIANVAHAQSGCTINGQPCATGVTSFNGQTGAVVATIPTPASTIPNMGPLNGSTGTAATYVPSDSHIPLPSQYINTTVAANCTWSVTFARTMTTSSPIVIAQLLLPSGATLPIPCQALARSATGASGLCFPAQTTTLNLSIITAGLNLSPFGTTCTAGTPVMVAASENTQ